MKKFDLQFGGRKYELEFEDKFYNYIVEDLEKINNSKNQVKDIIELMLSKSYKMYRNDKRIAKILKKLDL